MRFSLSAAFAFMMLGLLLACEPQVEAGTGVISEADPSPPPHSNVVPAAAGEGSVDSAWCRLDGAAKSELLCPLKLVVKSPTQKASALQFRVSWDPSELLLKGVRSSLCAPGGAPCAEVMSPPMKQVGEQGHSLATQPLDLSTANGSATLMLYHPTQPHALLEGEIAALVFEARQDLSAASVALDKLAATSPEAQAVPLGVKPGHLTLGL